MLLTSCGDDESGPKEIIEYEGPIRSVENAVILHSDSAIVTAKVTTPQLLEFDDGNQEMPQGVQLEFFDKEGRTTGKLKANYAIYIKEEDHWKATGDVELKNVTNNEQLNTEELFWNPTKEEVYTDKFVRIESPGQILLGEGLTAAQDFSSYQLKKLTGEITIEDTQ